MTSEQKLRAAVLFVFGNNEQKCCFSEFSGIFNDTHYDKELQFSWYRQSNYMYIIITEIAV